MNFSGRRILEAPDQAPFLHNNQVYEYSFFSEVNVGNSDWHPEIRGQSGNLGPREAQGLKSKSQILCSWVLLFLPSFSTLGSLLVQLRRAKPRGFHPY